MPTASPTLLDIVIPLPREQAETTTSENAVEGIPASFALDLLEGGLGRTLHMILAQHPDFRVRAAVARVAHLDPRAREVLLTDPDTEVRRAVAARPDLDEESQRLLSRDAASRVRIELARNAAVLPSTQRVLARDCVQAVLHALAVSPFLVEEVQDELATAPSWVVRQRLASSTVLGPSARRILARDLSAHVRAALLCE